MFRNTGTISTELFWRTSGHTSTFQICLLAINPLEWRCCTEPQLKPGLLASQKQCKAAAKLIQSYQVSTYQMKKHCLWQILSCIAVVPLPASCSVPGSTPCRWAKSRRSPVAKVPVAVGPRSIALQVPSVVLLSLPRQCCLDRLRFKLLFLVSHGDIRDHVGAWQEISWNITPVSESAHCHQARAGNVTGSFQILHQLEPDIWKGLESTGNTLHIWVVWVNIKT